MKTGYAAGLLFATSLLATNAFGQDKAVCLEAATKGQRFRDTHKLVEAREHLRICAAAACPAVVQSDCANWLAEVDKALPSVVVSVKNAAGADVMDVKVSVDGQPFVSKLDGQSVPINGGPHTFHFEATDGSTADQQVLIREGQKDQAVAVVLESAQPQPNPVAPAAADATPTAPSSSSTWRTVGWVLGGAGIVGLGLGTVFGIVAMNDKSSAHCDSNNVCDPGTTSAIKSAALVSDIGWVAGGVLLASGAALVLFSPGAGHEATAGTVKVAPVLTAAGAGAVLGATW